MIFTRKKLELFFAKSLVFFENQSVLILMSCLFPLFLAGQGYYNQENFGNRSILLSGSVTGSVDDLGLTYYNPSRLALIDEPNFTINAKAYQMSNVKIENVFGRNNKISDSKFEGLPSFVAGTFKIGGSEKHKFAYSVLSRRKSLLDLGFTREIDASVNEEFDNVERFVADLNIRNKETDEWFGISWATKLNEGFSIGVSTFVSVYDFSGGYQLNYSRLDNESNVAAYDHEINFGQKSYGIFWKIGLAWEVSKFELGLNINLPYLEVYGEGEFEYKEMLVGIGGGDDIFDYADWDNLDSNRKEPLGISFGAGLPLGKSKIHLKVDWHGKVSEYDRLVIPLIDDSGEVISFSFDEELRSVVNFGLGGEIYLGEKISFYLSAATDFSPRVSNANIFDLVSKRSTDTNFDADYFHYAFGIQLNLSWAELVLGSTYSTASTEFESPVDFPDQGLEIPHNDAPATIIHNRWRFIIGLEIPIFGHKVEIK